MLDEAVKLVERDSSWWSDCLAMLAEQREQSRFLMLYDHFAPKVATYLARLGASESMAEELTQETMLSVWRKASLYNRKKAAASTWIFTIARNQFIDSVRRQTISQEPISDTDYEDEAVIGPDMAADSAPVRRAISELPTMQSEVLYRSYFEGMSHSEIADALNIPLGSVKSNIRLVFQKL